MIDPVVTSNYILLLFGLFVVCCSFDAKEVGGHTDTYAYYCTVHTYIQKQLIVVSRTQNRVCTYCRIEVRISMYIG